MSFEKRRFLQWHLRQLSLKSPGLASLLFYIRWEIGEDTTLTAPLLVGGRSITVLPQFFLISEPAIRLGHLLKATLHVVLRHHERGVKLARSTRAFRQVLWGLACDLAVAGMVREAQWACVETTSRELSEMLRACRRAQHLPKLEGQAAERIYLTLESLLSDGALPDQTRADLQRLIESQAAAATAFKHEPDEENPTDDGLWEQRLARAKQTELPRGVLRRIQIGQASGLSDWRRRIRAYLTSSSVKSSRAAYARPSRRYLSGVQEVFTPGREGSPIVRRIGCILDTSASIQDATLARFFAELESLLGCSDEIFVVAADAAVHGSLLLRGKLDFDNLRPQLQKRIIGLGGTRFQPALDLCRRQRVDLAIYLTDLRGTFPPHAPPFPVIWATLDSDRAPDPPFGVQLSLDALE